MKKLMIIVMALAMMSMPVFATGVTTNLSATDTGDWMGADYNTVVYAFDSSHIYIGLQGGLFGVYDSTTNVATDLSTTDTGDWMSISGIKTFSALNSTNIYLGLGGGLFGVYNSVTNITTDLSATDTGDWISSNDVYSISALNSTNIYLGGDFGMFGVYNSVTNVGTTLMGTDTGDWLGSNGIRKIQAVDATHVYITTNFGQVGVYNSVTNVTTDLTSNFSWLGFYSVDALSVLDLTHIYVGLNDARFGVFDSTTNVSTELTDTLPSYWIGSYMQTYSIYAFNSTNIYLGLGGGLFGVYDSVTNVTTDLSATDTGDWMGTNVVYSISTLNSTNVYLGLTLGLFGVYDYTKEPPVSTITLYSPADNSTISTLVPDYEYNLYSDYPTTDFTDVTAYLFDDNMTSLCNFNFGNLSQGNHSFSNTDLCSIADNMTYYWYVNGTRHDYSTDTNYENVGSPVFRFDISIPEPYINWTLTPANQSTNVTLIPILYFNTTTNYNLSRYSLSGERAYLYDENGTQIGNVSGDSYGFGEMGSIPSDYWASWMWNYGTIYQWLITANMYDNVNDSTEVVSSPTYTLTTETEPTTTTTTTSTTVPTTTTTIEPTTTTTIEAPTGDIIAVTGNMIYALVVLLMAGFMFYIVKEKFGK